MADCDTELVGAVDVLLAGEDIGEVIGQKQTGVTIHDNITACIDETKPDVAVDFTHPDSVFNNAKLLIRAGVSPVIGTTGLTEPQLEELRQEAVVHEVSALVAPNFAIGAILMMHFATIASKYMQSAEIVELHHNMKVDAPSGTSIMTAGKMSVNPGHSDERETVPGVRGGTVNNVRIHSVRLPGLVAHQEVIFGGQGQTLTVRHDSIDRSSFMPGVILAIKNVKAHPGLTYGLENYLDL